MQAITVAIGPVGVSYFGQALLATELVGALGRLAPPPRSFTAPDFRKPEVGGYEDFSKIKIDLSQGGFSGFAPTFGGLLQQAGGHFQVPMSVSNFDATYTWSESFHDNACSTGRFGHCTPFDKTAGPFAYRPHFDRLGIQITLGFEYDRSSNAYDVTVIGVNAAPSGVTPNVPPASVIQNEDQQCFASHVSDATANAVSSIDFKTPIAALFGPLFKSIPASGHLTADIAYDFSVGDSGLTFPGDQGLAIGVTGAVTYKGERYPGKPPAALPVPPAPTDANHLRAYVSSYEFDALNWAFFKAGLLNVTVDPHDLPDPDVLHVNNYTNVVPALKPYSGLAMQAKIAPKEAPKTSFQVVWVFSADVMAALKDKLPPTVYKQLGGIDGENYVAEADLDADLKAARVTDAGYVTKIKQAGQTTGMVVAHDLEFTITIQTGDPDPPNMIFDVDRIDVLRNLGLGVSGGAQTLKFSFGHARAVAKFVSTTIPHIDGPSFGFLWNNAGELPYDTELGKIGGGAGVPLPIMQGFHFLFDKAQLSVQEGYVSVLAQVEFKKPAAPPA
ncbi:MAG TPA: hypothetical protein VF712_20055 [Thermoleophilaceae bacterium]|jgi:hypothetical protein